MCVVGVGEILTSKDCYAKTYINGMLLFPSSPKNTQKKQIGCSRCQRSSDKAKDCHDISQDAAICVIISASGHQRKYNFLDTALSENICLTVTVSFRAN